MATPEPRGSRAGGGAGRARSAPPGGIAAGVHLAPHHLYKTALLLLAAALFYRFFREITTTLLLVYAAAIVAVAFNPLVRRLPLHRKLLAGLIGVAALASVGLVLWFGVPALFAQVREFAERAPEFQQRLEEWADWVRDTTGLNIALVGERTAQIAGGALQALGTEELFGRARGALEVLLVPLIVLIGGMYALADPNRRLLDPLIRVVPPAQRAAWYRIFRLLGERLFDWIRGTFIAMVTVGALSSLALYLLGVPYWLLLGTIIGLLEFIVIFGPWIGGVPAVVIAFLHDPMTGVWAAVAIIAIQQLESYVITPWAMSQAARIHPLITLFALIFFGSIFGILGILLALPLVILGWTLIQVLWVERKLGTATEPLEPVVEE